MNASRAARAAGLFASALVASSAALAMSTPSEEIAEALHLKPHLTHGAEIFEMCAACHGPDGHGAPDGSVPAIAGQPMRVIVKQIVEFRYDARLNVRMQHFVDRHHLTAPQELADVAAYVSSLPPRQPATVGGNSREGPGAALFADSCASCHGAHAQGSSARRVPRLAGQYAEYLDAQLHDAAEGGRPSMRRDHARLLARLSSDDMAAISRYLAGIAPAGSPAGSGARRD